jgi:cytochrome c-type biogenesis protein CcmH
VLVAPASAGPVRPTLAELERELMCPTCGTVLELSHAPAADRMRAFIRTRIAAGDTKEQIKAGLVRDFGKVVLASPPREGFDLLAWLLPLVGVPLAAIIIGVIAMRWQLRTSAAQRQPDRAPRSSRLDPARERRLDEELARFDS